MRSDWRTNYPEITSHIERSAVPIEAARQGFKLGTRNRPPLLAPTGQPTLNRLFFSLGITDFGLPKNIITSAPSGTSELFLFFDFQNMTPGLPYQLIVTLNGAEYPQLGLGPLPWGTIPNGTWYIGTQGIVWPDGSYDFTLLLNSQPVASSNIVIGGPSTGSSFSNLVL